MSLLASLRASTAACHQRLEERVDIEKSVHSVTEYTRILRLFYGFYAPLEQALVEAQKLAGLGWPPSPTTRAQWLTEDLKVLGVNASEVVLCPQRGARHDTGSFIGTTYVVEGAALGGQVIVRRIKEKGLNLPTRFFTGNGEGTAPRWRAFMAWVEGHDLADDEKGAACSAAVNTFETLTQWMKNT